MRSSKYFLWMFVMAMASLVFVSSAPIASAQQTSANSAAAAFTNSAPITINDANPASPYPSTINVSGLSGTIPTTPGSIKVTLNGFSHTFSDDVGIVLVGPTGAAFLLQDGAGDDPDMVNVTYTLSDDGAAVLPNATAWAAGTYKPTSYYSGDSFPSPGPGTAYGLPGPVTGGTATFASVFGGTNPNGVWSLYVVDFVSGDDGNIAGGWTLEINTGAAARVQHVVDYNGDGKTDWSVVRNTGGGTSGQVTWLNCINGVAEPGCISYQQWGLANDVFVSGDFDGDGKSDMTVWRSAPAGSAAFYILQSATSTVRTDYFGQTGDDPTVVGDYTGDGKADAAVYRPGASAGQQSYWFYRVNNDPVTGGIAYEQWGQNGDYPAPGDYDGDGKYDFMVQRAGSGGQANFFLRTNTTNSISTYTFGLSSDLIVPGDYDGDGKCDIATVRAGGGQILWFYRSSITGNTVYLGAFGNATGDFIAQGDYDGDGKTDQAVWRSSDGNFYVQGSSSGFISKHWGQSGDYPIATYNHH